MPPRIVFDTNVWLSALLWRGDPYRCLALARSAVVTPIYCDPMLAELARKLREGFGFTENQIQATLYEYRRVGVRIKITENLRGIARDPDDDKFIECAVVGNAEAIVSKDRHLLEVDPYEDIRILRPNEFLAHYGQR